MTFCSIDSMVTKLDYHVKTNRQMPPLIDLYEQRATQKVSIIKNGDACIFELEIVKRSHKIVRVLVGAYPSSKYLSLL